MHWYYILLIIFALLIILGCLVLFCCRDYDYTSSSEGFTNRNEVRTTNTAVHRESESYQNNTQTLPLSMPLPTNGYPPHPPVSTTPYPPKPPPIGFGYATQTVQPKQENAFLFPTNATPYLSNQETNIEYRSSNVNTAPYPPNEGIENQCRSSVTNTAPYPVNQEKDVEYRSIYGNTAPYPLHQETENRYGSYTTRAPYPVNQDMDNQYSSYSPNYDNQNQTSYSVNQEFQHPSTGKTPYSLPTRPPYPQDSQINEISQKFYYHTNTAPYPPKSHNTHSSETTSYARNAPFSSRTPPHSARASPYTSKTLPHSFSQTRTYSMGELPPSYWEAIKEDSPRSRYHRLKKYLSATSLYDNM